MKVVYRYTHFNNRFFSSQILALVEEVTRLRSALSDLQESHNTQLKQIQLLEGRLDAKRQHISRLEARLDKQAEFDDIKKENR